MNIKKINIGEKFKLIRNFWEPRIVGKLNGQHVKLARLRGKFIWHSHEHEDEMFLIIEGRLRIELENSTLDLSPGEMVIIPRGVRHRPVANNEVKVMLFEPETTLNTGDKQHGLTRPVIDEI